LVELFLLHQYVTQSNWNTAYCM